MNTVTLRYGATREIVRDLPTSTTVQDVLRDPSIRASLSLPENVVAVVDGRTLHNSDRFNNGDTVTFEKQAASKAV